ncbi:MAG: ABC transporter permease, partial [Candidatus Cloacimonadota bacterium]
MKTILLTILLASSLLFSENIDYKIIDTTTNQEIGLKGMVEKLSDFSIIFFGEFHDNKILHDLELELLKIYYSKNKNLLISMEMFERDVQPVLDKYLSDEITEEEFLANSRPWPNYETDYKPLIEFAKENELVVVAANIPRRYANMISKQGLNALDSLSMEEKEFVAK